MAVDDVNDDVGGTLARLFPPRLEQQRESAARRPRCRQAETNASSSAVRAGRTHRSCSVQRARTADDSEELRVAHAVAQMFSRLVSFNDANRLVRAVDAPDQRRSGRAAVESANERR